MISVFLLSCLLLGASAVPVNYHPEVQEKDLSVVGNDASFAFGVDIAVGATVSQFSCLRTNGYQAVFIRVYNPAGSGAVDSNAVNNINNAYTAGIGSEAYMTPQPKSSKSGAQQFNEVNTALRQKSINLRTIWIQVTSPLNWNSVTTTNINFINSIVTAARQAGMSVGIYTSSYDWSQITGNYNGVGSDVMLWYWNVFGSGVNGESPADFSDFRPFANWKQASAKQFAQVESLCSMTVNRDVFPSSNLMPMEGMAHREQGITVGRIGLH